MSIQIRTAAALAAALVIGMTAPSKAPRRPTGGTMIAAVSPMPMAGPAGVRPASSIVAPAMRMVRPMSMGHRYSIGRRASPTDRAS